MQKCKRLKLIEEENGTMQLRNTLATNEISFVHAPERLHGG